MFEKILLMIYTFISSCLTSIFRTPPKKFKGSAEIVSAIIACTVISVVAYKGAGVAELAYSGLASYNYKNTAMHYALNEVDTLRNIGYSSIEAMPSSSISDVEKSNHTYTKKVTIEDSDDIPVAHDSGTSYVKGKKITVEVGRGSIENNTYENAVDSKFVITRVNPASYDSKINMVTNDASSKSTTQAMSANAFKDLIDSKISNNPEDVNTDIALSASAAKRFLDKELLNYAKKSQSARRDKDIGIGNQYQGVYINVDGKAMPCNVTMRGKLTNDQNALILVPVKSGDTWYFDTIKRNDLYTGYHDYTWLPFTIVQTPHQTITVVVDNTSYISDFIVKRNSTWTAFITPETGYNAGTLSAKNGIVAGAVTLTATPAQIKKFNFSIKQSDHQTITVTANGKTYTSDFVADYGTKWTATITPDEGYNAGQLSATSGTVTGAYTLSAEDAQLKKYTVTIKQQPHQTIIVTVNGKDYTSNFEAEHGTKWTAKIIPDTGYDAGKLSVSSGTLTSNIIISASAPIIKKFNFTIIQSPNQTITVTANGQEYTTDFVADYGTKWTAKITPATGFTAGTLSVTSGTVTGPVTVSATAAAAKTFTLKINDPGTGVKSYNIKITKGSIGSMPSGWTSGITKTGFTKSNAIGRIPYGSSYEVTFIANEGYSLNKTTFSGTMTSDVNCELPTSSVIYRTLSIPAVSTVTGISSYTIKLTKGNVGNLPTGYTSGVTSNAFTSATKLSVPYGTQYVVTYTPATGYTLNKTNDTGKITNSDINIVLPTASVRLFTLNIGAITEGVSSYSVKLTKGNLGTLPSGWISNVAKTGLTSASSIKNIPYGTQYEIIYTPKTGYNINKAKDTGTIVGDVSVPMATASVKTFKLSVPKVSTGIKNYSIKLTKGSLGVMPSGWTSGTAKTGLTAATSVNSIPYGTSYEVNFTAEDGYTITNPVQKGTITSDVNVPMPSVGVKTYSLVIPAVPTGVDSYSVKLIKGNVGNLPSGWSSGTAKTKLTSANTITGIPYGTSYEIIYNATTGYTISKSKDNGTITANVNLSQPTASVIYKTLSVDKIVSGMSGYTIKLTKGSIGTLPSGYTSGIASETKTTATSISIPYGTQYLITYNISQGYSASKTSDSGTITTSDVTIHMPVIGAITYSLTVPSVSTGVSSYSIKITKGSSGTMPSGWTSGTAKTGLTAQTIVSTIPYGSTYEVIYNAATGYTISKSKDSGTLTNNISLIQPTASVIYKTLKIPAPPTGVSYTVKLTKGSVGNLPSGYTSGTASSAIKTVTSLSVPYGTQYEVTYSPDTGYSVSKQKDNGTITTSDVSLTMPTASIRNFVLNIPKITSGISNYSVKLTKGSLGTLPSGWTSGTTKTGFISATTIAGIPYGSSYEVIYTPAEGYNASKTKDTGTLTNSTTLTMPTATIKTFSLSIPTVTEGIKSYSVKLTVGNLGTLPTGWVSGTAKTGITTATGVIGIPYGTSYNIDYVAEDGYTLNKTNDNGVLKSDITIPMPGVNVKYFTLTLLALAGATYILTLTSGGHGSLPPYTSTDTSDEQVLKVPYGTKYSVKYKANKNYTTDKDEDSGTITKDTTITKPNINLNRGVLLYDGTTSNANFNTPTGCKYVTINALYSYETYGDYSGYSTLYTLAKIRVPVKEKQNYSIIAYDTPYKNTSSYPDAVKAGTYSNVIGGYNKYILTDGTSDIGNICHPYLSKGDKYIENATTVFYRIYTDTDELTNKNPYTDVDYKKWYKTITNTDYSE